MGRTSYSRMMCGWLNLFRLAISRRTFSCMSSLRILLRFRILIATLYPVRSCVATAQGGGKRGGCEAGCTRWTHSDARLGTYV